MDISELVYKAHKNAVEKGFWDKPREFGTMIALVHSELSEALEADRHGDKGMVAEEIADVFIRLGDLCGGLDIDIERAIKNKMTERTCATCHKVNDLTSNCEVLKQNIGKSQDCWAWSDDPLWEETVKKAVKKYSYEKNGCS